MFSNIEFIPRRVQSGDVLHLLMRNQQPKRALLIEGFSRGGGIEAVTGCLAKVTQQESDSLDWKFDGKKLNLVADGNVP